MKHSKTIIILVFIFVVSLAIIYLSQPFLWLNEKNAKTNGDCVTAQTEKTVRGSSMEPLIKAGQTLILLENYYQCHPVQRGDIIAYEYKGNENPLIKKVKVLGGDAIKFQKNNLLVNGKILKNSQSRPYVFSQQSKKMINLYIKNEKLIDSAYLILGENVSDALDSRHFGAVSANDFLGKFKIS